MRRSKGLLDGEQPRRGLLATRSCTTHATNTPNALRYTYAKCGVFEMVCSAENPINLYRRPQPLTQPTTEFITHSSLCHRQQRVASTCVLLCQPPLPPPDAHRTHHAHPPAQPGQRLDQSFSLAYFHACVCVCVHVGTHTHRHTHTGTRYKNRSQRVHQSCAL